MNLPYFPSGTTFAGYRLQDVLGEGAAGVVYRAEHEPTRTEVAVKLMRIPDGAPHQERTRLRFQREARALAQLEHPHVIRLLDHGDADIGGIRYPFLVTEFLPGFRTLDEARQECESVSWILERAADLLEALDHMHRRREPIVHRDLKPRNIGLLPDGRLVLIDFGIACMAGQPALTRTGTPMGTLWYMSPEQMDDARHVDPRTDLYSLGMMLLELIGGGHPFGELTEFSPVLKLLLIDRCDVLTAMRRGILPPTPRPIPGPLEPFLSRLVAVDPADRFGSALEALEFMRRLSILDIESRAEPGRPLVGRESMVADLEERWRRARDGRGSVVYLWGPEGIGKTRILEEVSARAGTIASWVRGMDGLTALLECNPDARSIVAALIGSTRGRPALLAIDDVAPSDTLLIECLRLAARNAAGRRYLILSAGRSPLPAHDIAGIEVGPLSPEASRSFLPDPSHAHDRALQAAGGNPGLLLDLATWLAQKTDTADDSLVAEFITEKFRRRLRLLDAPAQRLLGIAGILGIAFDTDALDALLGEPADMSAFPSILCEAGPRRWQFKPELFADAAVDLLSPDERRQFHRAAAGWLERDRSRDTRWQVASHLESALPTLAAAPDEPADVAELREHLGQMLFSLGDEAIQTGRLAEAYGILGRAYSVVSHSRLASLWSRTAAGLAFAAMYAGRTGEASLLVFEALHLEASLDVEHRALVLNWCGRVLQEVGDLEESRNIFERAHALMPACSPLTRFRIGLNFAHLGALAPHLLPLDRALRLLDEALDAARSGAVSPRLQALAMNSRAHVFGLMGDFASAGDIYRELRTFPLAAAERAEVLSNLGCCIMEDDEDLRAAEPVLLESLQAARESNVPFLACLTSGMLGLLYGRQGRFPEAEAALDAAAPAHLNPWSNMLYFLYSTRAFVLALAWRGREGIPLAERVLSFTQDREPEMRADAHNSMGLAYLAEGDAAAAQEHFEQAIRDAAPLACRDACWDAVMGLAQVALFRGRFSDAARHVAELEDLQMQPVRRPTYKEAIRTGLYGRLLADRGDWAGFREETERALRLLRDLGVRAHEFAVLCEAAATAGSLGPPPAIRDLAESWVHQAIRLGTLMQAPAAVDRARSLWGSRASENANWQTDGLASSTPGF